LNESRNLLNDYKTEGAGRMIVNYNESGSEQNPGGTNGNHNIGYKNAEDANHNIGYNNTEDGNHNIGYKNVENGNHNIGYNNAEDTNHNIGYNSAQNSNHNIGYNSMQDGNHNIGYKNAENTNHNIGYSNAIYRNDAAGMVPMDAAENKPAGQPPKGAKGPVKQDNQKQATKPAEEAKEDTKEGSEKERTDRENEKLRDQKISEYGQVTLKDNDKEHKIHLLTIIGEIEGHECLSQNTKTTKYEHVLPQLAAIEDSKDIDGLLILINTVGGDVESGLAIAEMISSLTKPTVSLVLGGGHSIGVPLAVSTKYSFIVPSGTMIIHPVRMSGTVIGAPQTFDYFKLIQDRIVGFIATHSNASKEKLEKMMMNTGILTKDLGTILVGEDAVKEGLINQVGGIREAMQKLHQMIDESKQQ